MKVSYRWIRSLAPDLVQTHEEASERLAELGFPVERVEPLAEGLGDIVVARVLEVRSHPNADRLRVCEVDGGNGVVQVVCGADNVRDGAWYPLAPVGATLPDGMRIRKARIRGENSEGMLCSERELRLGRGHEGIMELAREAGAFIPGTSLVEVLDLQDVRLDVEVTSNRPDLLSHRGLARELAPEGHGSLVDPAIPGEASGMAEKLSILPVVADPREATAGGVTIRVQDPDLCPRYLGMVIRGVTVGPSPSWLQNRLRAAGARSINNVVDATNYVLLELGQPLHAFDLDRLEKATIEVRRAREGEGIRTLDREDRRLGRDMLAICDARHPVAVAGVMGGEESEVGPSTTDVFLECALFTPGPVRATRKALGLSTDASYRFERGVDPQGLRVAMDRCARIILATAGGEVGEAILEVAPSPPALDRIVLRPSRVERVLGVAFPAETIVQLLEPLGFQVDEDGEDALSVAVPGYRCWDVTREVDLIEEIARRHGYDHFPDVLGAFRPGSVPDHPLFRLEDDLRTEMTAWGLLEAQTPAFAPEGEGDVEVVNPISMEERWLRSSLLPALLRRVRYNLARGNRDVRLYEIGTVFTAGPQGELPRERTRLAVVLHGHRMPSHWAGTDKEVNLWEVKGLLESILRRIPDTGWTVTPWGLGTRSEAELDGEPGLPLLEPGLSFEVRTEEGAVVGVGGQVPPAGLDLPPWAGAVWGVEITLPAEPATPPAATLEPLPTHPGVDRDLALLLSEEHAAGGVLDRLRLAGGTLLHEVSVFDVYRGEGVPEGFRSLAVRLHFRAEDRTLTDGEVEEAVASAIQVLEEEFGVRIRGG